MVRQQIRHHYSMDKNMVKQPHIFKFINRIGAIKENGNYAIRNISEE